MDLSTCASMMPVMELFQAAKEAAERKLSDMKKIRWIESINVEGDGINVSFRSGEHEVIDFNDWCEWCTDVTRGNRNHKKLRPEDVTQWSVEPEMVLLYVRWHLGYYGAALEEIEEEVFLNEDYPG